MSGDGKRGVGHRPQATAPILDSTWAAVSLPGGHVRCRMNTGRRRAMVDGPRVLRVVGRLPLMNGATGSGGRRPTTLRERNRGPRRVRWWRVLAYGDLIAAGCRWRCERQGGRARW